MKQILHINAHQDFEEGEGIDIKNLNFHTVIKDIENIFWTFLLSNKALSLPETQNILSLDDNFSEMLEKYNNWTKLSIKKDPNNPHMFVAKLNVQAQMISLGKAMAMLMYDFLLASKYNFIINKDNEIQFLRYIRNGSVHNNTFNLKDEDGNWKMAENEIIEWRNKKITRTLHGKQVFPDYMTMFGMFLLGKDLSEKLKKLDSKNIRAKKL